jgi:hypothetical protein
MNLNRKTLMSVVGAAALAVSAVAASGPAFAQKHEARGVVHARQQQPAPGHEYRDRTDIFQSNANGNQPYANPDREFGGPNSFGGGE